LAPLQQNLLERLQLPKIDTPVITNSQTEDRGKRWVEVPLTDIFEFPFPTVRVNLMEFGPGKHFVDAILADWIETRVRIRQKADIAILQKNPDRKAQDVMSRNGTAGRQGGFVDNPDQVFGS
jgi:hypothetical protein